MASTHRGSECDPAYVCRDYRHVTGRNVVGVFQNKWILLSFSLMAPAATSSSLVPSTRPGRISRSTRSRPPRSTQRPLTLQRSRRDGGDGVLTGATRRLRQVQCALFPCKLTPCVVVVFKYLRPGRVTSPLSERGEVFTGFQVAWYGRQWYDYATCWRHAVGGTGQ